MAGGDESKVQSAISHAELAGIPNEQVQLFRGQLATFYGRPVDALDILTPLSENSVAALSLLSIAQMNAGNPQANNRTVTALRQRLRETDKLTQFDRLFAAYACIDEDPAVPHTLIDGVLEQRDSPLARMIVATVLAASAHESHDVEVIKEAIRHVDVAVAFGADAPSFVDAQLMVRHIALVLGLPEDATFTSVELRDYEKKVADNRMAKASLIRLLADIGDGRALDLVESSVGHVTDVEMGYYVPILLEHRSPQEVLAFIESNESHAPFTLCMKAYVMALVPKLHDESRKLCDKLLSDETSSTLRVGCLLTLMTMGDLEDVRMRSRQLINTSDTPRWYSAERMQYYAGLIDQETFLANAESRLTETEARFAVAAEQIGQGNQEAAVRNLRRCIDLGMVQLENYYFAKTFLKAIETEREWATQMVSGR